MNRIKERGAAMGGLSSAPVRRASSGVGRLVRRLEHERKRWASPSDAEVPTETAWRAGVAEGIRLAQLTIRKGV